MAFKLLYILRFFNCNFIIDVMSNKNSDQLFQLIQSLNKGEKRHFKLYASRHKGGENAKFLKLFDLINNQTNFNEGKILAKDKALKPSQLPNLKQNLYKQIMASLRMLHSGNDITLSIREIIDNATILYNRCLYQQSLKTLEKGKELAKKYEKNVLLLDIHNLEKKLISKIVKKDIQDRIDGLVPEGEQLLKKLTNINTFSNLSSKLYGLYIKLGFTRNSADFEIVNSFLYSSLPAFKEENLSLEEKMYLYNAFVAYYFFIQDYRRASDYAKKLVGLFEGNDLIIQSKLEMYVKAINSLLDSQSKLSQYEEFIQTSLKFEAIVSQESLRVSDNVNYLMFKYSSKHNLDKYFMLGEFNKGVIEVEEIASKLDIYADKLNDHSKQIFYYKFACMYFGNNQYKDAVTWLNKIINAKDEDIRSDISGFARILILISHYELNNDDLVEYYVRSTYRFLAKKDDLHFYQTRILRFLKRLNSIATAKDLHSAFADLLDHLIPLTTNPYEKRAFVYFDIISWLESKIQNRPVKEVIREKALKRIASANEKDLN